MNHRSILLLSFILLIGTWSCGERSGKNETSIDALVGTWTLSTHPDEKRTFIEEWSKENDTSYNGSAYILNNNTDDHFNEEKLWMKFRNGEWVYITAPSGQDHTVFAMTEFTGNMFRFENPQHNFPQYISYTWISPDSVVSEVGDTAWNTNVTMIRMD